MKRKHTLRSMLSMVCAIVMIVSMVPVLPVAAEDVFYDTMESYTVDTDLYAQAANKYTKESPAWGHSSFTSSNQGSVAVAADPVNGGNKVLAVTSKGQDKRYVLTVAPKVTGDYTLQFDYMPTDAASNAGSGFLDVYINNGKSQLARINYRDEGSFFYNGDFAVSSAIKNLNGNKDKTWYSVRIVVSADKYVMDIWEKGLMEETRLTTEASGLSANLGTNVEFCFGPYDAAWGVDTSVPITNYIDNIRITSGVVEAVDSAVAAGAGEAFGSMIDFADDSEIVNKEAVAITAGMGLFAGKEGNRFDPAGVLTRAEMATIIVKMLRGNTFNADNFKGYSKFPDTAGYQGGWAEGYISACAQMGIVTGYGDGTFKPGNPVTTAEALTMIINALGVAAGEGEWPATVMAKAQEMKLYGDLAITPGTYDALTRDQLAVLVCEGMSYSPSGITGWKLPNRDDLVFTEIADAVRVNGGSADGLIEVVGEDALANKVYALKIFEGFITANQSVGEDEFTTVTAYSGTGDPISMRFDMVTGLDELGHYVTVYYREDYRTERNPGLVYNYVDKTQVITVDKKITTPKDYKAIFGKSIKEAKLTDNSDAVLLFNEYYDVRRRDSISGYTEGTKAEAGTYLINDGVINAYIPDIPVYAAQVRAVNDIDGSETIELSGVIALISNSEDDDRIEEYPGIKKDDYVTYVKIGSGVNTIYILTKANAIGGIVEKTSVNKAGKQVVTVKGKNYVSFGEDNNSTGLDTNTDTDYLSWTDSYTFYVTGSGKYIGYEKNVDNGLNLSETVFVLGELQVLTTDNYGQTVQKTTARGVDMRGNEVNLLVKVEKNGIKDSNGNYWFSKPITDPMYKPLTDNTFYRYALSNDTDAKKEGIYILTPYPDSYDKETAPVYTGARITPTGSPYSFFNTGIGDIKSGIYSNSGAVYIMMEGDKNQTEPLSTIFKTSWDLAVNSTGHDMKEYFLLSRNSEGGQMIDAVVMMVENDPIAAINKQVYYVTEEGRDPVGSDVAGYIYNVYDYKTGRATELTLETDDPQLKDGKIPEAGFWHTVPDVEGGFNKLLGRVKQSELDGNQELDGSAVPNRATYDELVYECILYDQQFKTLLNGVLDTTNMKNGQKATTAVVVDTRTEREITAAGIGKIDSVGRIATLSRDYPEVSMSFDLCYSSSSKALLTVFVKDLHFTSTEGGAQIRQEDGVWYLDGRVVADNVKISDTSGSLRNDPADRGAVLAELEKVVADGGTVEVTYSMSNGKVSEIIVTAIKRSDEPLFHVDFDSLRDGNYNPNPEGGAPFVAKTSSGTYDIDVVSEGSGQALKMTTTGGTESTLQLESKDKIPAGNYTVEVRVKADEKGNVSQFQLPGITFPITKGTGKQYTLNISGTKDKQERPTAVYLYLSGVTAENGFDGETTALDFYNNGDKMSYAADTWYTVKIHVNAEDRTVFTEIYNDAGALLGSRTLTGATVAETTVNLHNYSYTAGTTRTVWFDYVTVGEYAGPSKHSVTIPWTPNGTLVEKNGTTVAVAGDTLTFVATSRAGYKLAQLWVNEEEEILEGNYDLSTTVEVPYTMIDKDIEVKAVFAELEMYEVTVDIEGEGGVVEIVDGNKFIEGATVEINVEPDDGYRVGRVVVDNVLPGEDGTYSFTMPAKDVTVLVEFWDDTTQFHEDFEYCAEGTYDNSAAVDCFDRDKGTVEVDNGSKVLKMEKEGTSEINSKSSHEISGSWTMEARLKANGLGKYTKIYLSNVKVPGKNNKTSAYDLRFAGTSDGNSGIYIYLTNAVSNTDALPGETGGTTKVLGLYSDGTEVGFATDAWYTVKIHLNKTTGTLITELYNDAGTLLGSRELTGVAYGDDGNTLVRLINTGASGKTRVTYWDYVTVKEYEYQP